MSISHEQAVATSPFRESLGHIRNALRNNTAAVLVGSGFSRNAAPEMPSWDSWAKQLAGRMELEEEVIKHAKAQDVPWLAGAYAERHGLPLMRDLLFASMRDINILHVGLHEQLVCLPWTDIFTTNYDKFLEDAAQQAQTAGNLSRPYNVIVSHNNFPLSRKEQALRIIKLHGCLSKEEDCIVTEEDYRTYRDKRAAFVNTVRQTLLENHLCLIGYSATDPDFLEWIGWVRDRLENQRLNIYWLSKEQLTQDEMSIYKQRGITCISLDCFSHVVSPSAALAGTLGGQAELLSSALVERPEDRNLYYTVYANFLNWLKLDEEREVFPASIQSNEMAYPETVTKNEKLSDRSEPPDFKNKGVTAFALDTASDLPASSKYRGLAEATELWDYPNIDEVNLSKGMLSWKEIQELTSRMKQARENYPGWLLPPIKILRQLWDMHMSASFLVRQIKKMQSDVSEHELLEALREVCWLLDMANIPTFNECDKILEEILDTVLPHIRVNSKEQQQQLKTTNEVSMWMACSLLLLRWVREEREDLRFEKIAKNLEWLLHRFPDSDTSAALKYQRILFRLEKFDHPGALRLTRNWRLDSTVSKISFIRKAMLLGELGDVKQGYELLKEQYEALLSQVKAVDCLPEILSIARLTAESLRQFNLLVKNNWFSMYKKEQKRYAGIPKDFKDMLPPLSRAEPDISAILEKLRSDVKSAVAAIQIAPSKIIFETGKRDNSWHLYSGLWPGFREAFQYLGAMEKLCRTPYLGYASFEISTWLEASQLLFYLHRGLNNQSLRPLLRSAPGNTFKSGQDIFLQYNLAMLEEEEIHSLAECLIQGLQTTLLKTRQDPLDERYTRFGLELLSRLCLRVSLPKKQQTFLDVALQWMQQGPAWKRIGSFEQMCLFCRRAVESASYSQLKFYLARLLSSPVFMGFTFDKAINYHLNFSFIPDIVAALPDKFFRIDISDDLRTVAKNLWEELKKNEKYKQVIQASDGQPEKTENSCKNLLSRYYWRLLWMLKHDLVDKSTRADMAEYIWSQYKEQGLPELPGMKPFTILDWPVPIDIDVVDRYKTMLFKQIIPPAYSVTEDGRRAYSSKYVAPLEDYLNIGIERRKRLNLTYSDKLCILQNCYRSDFLENEKEKRIKHYACRPLESIIWILTYVVADSLKALQKDAPWLPKWISSLITYGESIGARCQRLKVLNLLFEHSEAYAENLALELEELIYSDDRGKQIDSGFAILLWRSEIEIQISDDDSPSRSCPKELSNAILRGFWLMECKQATSLAAVLIEQYECCPQLSISDKEKHIILRALKNKLHLLGYKESLQLCFPPEEAHINDWIALKERLELLPEHRLALGKMLTTICKTIPDICNADIIQLWLQEMNNDPLASMRRKGEEAGQML